MSGSAFVHDGFEVETVTGTWLAVSFLVLVGVLATFFVVSRFREASRVMEAIFRTELGESAGQDLKPSVTFRASSR